MIANFQIVTIITQKKMIFFPKEKTPPHILLNLSGLEASKNNSDIEDKLNRIKIDETQTL